MKTVIEHPVLGAVTLSRTRRARRITVTVRPPGRITLSFPMRCPKRDALAFLDEKAEWTLQTLARQREKWTERLIEMPYATRQHALRFDPQDTASVTTRITADEILVRYPLSLHYGAPEVQEAARKAIVETLRREAKELLPALTEEIARQHGFRYRSVTVRATVSKWGSCSGKNDLSLNLYLLRLPDHLVRYVVTHELCHTVHKDHSARFHALLDKTTGGNDKLYSRELRGYRPDIF